MLDFICLDKGERTVSELDIPTLKWVLKRIHGYDRNSDYDYSASLDSLQADVELAIKREIAWDEIEK